MKIFVFFLIAVFSFGCFGKYKKPIKTGLEGKMLPKFGLLLSDSITYINTNNIPEGKPVVLFYFSPQCPYCRDQLADMIKEIDVLKDVRIYMITGFPLPAIKDFLEEYELYKYPNITMGRDSTEYLAHYFNVPGVPYTAIYGKDKRLKGAFAGRMKGKQIKDVAAN